MFLGDWCLLSNRKHIWSKLDYKVVPYHWSDSHDMFHDAKIVRELYERLLVEMRTILNSLHNIDWSIRAWRILIGPWLSSYIEIILDRWLSVQSAQENFNIIGLSYIKIDWQEMLSWTHDSWGEKVKTDKWNYFIYSKLLKHQNNIKMDSTITSFEVEKKSIENKLQSDKISYTIKRAIIFPFKKFIRGKIYQLISMALARRNKYYFFQTYIKSKFKVAQLSMLLGDYPILRLEHKTISPIPLQKTIREKIIFDSNVTDGFECFVRKMLPISIPRIYIEGFKDLLDCVKKENFPQRNKAIITTIGIFKDEVFKTWVAQSVQKGVKLILGQHGGQYGTSLFSLFEEHEIKVSDKYLTWGWKDTEEKTIAIPAPILITNRKNKWDRNGSIAIVVSEMGRYLSQMHPYTLFGDRSKIYFDFLVNLIKNLNREHQKKLCVKLFPTDGERGNPMDFLLRENFPWIQIIKNISFTSIINRSRLSVHMKEGTTFLEAIGNDQPCILVFDPLFIPLRDSAKPFFRSLEDVGIYHENPASAASMIQKVSNNIESWWYRDDVKKVKNAFCNEFVRKSNNPIKDIKEIILNSI